MILAHKIALDPTFAQRAYFARAAGTARFTWNWGLAKWNELYEQGQKSSGRKLRELFNQSKYREFPWLKNIHRDAHAQPFAQLQSAFNAFFKGTARRPRFKSKKQDRERFYVANDQFSVNGLAVRLPVVGWVRLCEALRFVGKIMGATVSREAQRWYIAIQVDVGDVHKDRSGDAVHGIDLGLRVAATLDTGEPVEGPKPLRRRLKQLKRLSRALSRKQRGSANRFKARCRLARLHARIGNIRKDFLHKLTTRLARESSIIVIEDLSVCGMLANHKLARAIGDIGFFEFRRQLEYKTQLYGTEVIVADRWFPSSKLCSRCGHIKGELPLSQRVYVCERCGLVLDRDHNAALNLRTLGFRGSHACGPEGADGRVPPTVKPCRVEAGTKPCPLVDTN